MRSKVIIVQLDVKEETTMVTSDFVANNPGQRRSDAITQVHNYIIIYPQII